MKSTGLDRRQKRSRDALRKAFLELIEEKDFSRITVTEIAERADRDRKTFYLHYSSIDDLVDELLYEEIEQAIERLEKLPLVEDGKINVATLYDALGTEMLTSVQRFGGALKHVDASELIETKRSLFVEALVKRDSLGFARILGPYLDLFVTFFYSGLLALYGQWLSQDSELPLNRLADLAAAAVTGGVASLVEAAKELDVSEAQPCAKSVG